MKDPRMNDEHGPFEDNDAPLPDTLRWQLRGLRRAQEPTNDLWPGIAGRLPPRDALTAPPRQRRGWVPVAMAASVLLAVGALGWSGMLGNNVPGSSPLQSVRAPEAAKTGAETPPALMATEASALANEYQAAFREIGPLPADGPMRSVIDELDRNANQILAALAEQPDSRLLFDQLRRTYARRLAVSQRVLHS